MRDFYNNPSNVLQYQVPLHPDDELRAGLLTVVKRLLSDQYPQTWATIIDSEQAVDISLLTGGITNILYLITERISGHQVIVRLFGAGTAAFIDRDSENLVLATLSKRGLGPEFFGLFLNGRVEGFIPHSRSLEPAEMTLTPVFPLIARSIALLHKQDIDGLQTEHSTSSSSSSLLVNRWLWVKIQQFFDIVSGANYSAQQQEFIRTDLNISDMVAQLRWLEEFISKQQAIVSSSSSFIGKSTDAVAGRKFALEQVLCHNDLLSGNLLLVTNSNTVATATEAKATTAATTITATEASLENSLQIVSQQQQQRIQLIDYEYAAYNYRAFDIANHFCECCGFECDYVNNFPSAAHMDRFLALYLEEQQSQQAATATAAVTTVADTATVASSDNTSVATTEAFTITATATAAAEFVTGYREAVCWFVLASHLFWGSWSLVQAASSPIDFDYLGYAKLRFDGYNKHKKMFVAPEDDV